TRRGSRLSLLTINCVPGSLTALTMRSFQAVKDRFRLLTSRGDHTTPRVLDSLVGGSSCGFPCCTVWTMADCPLFRGSVTGRLPLETGAPRLKSVGGLKAVACVPRSSSRSGGRNSTPVCHVGSPPKSL